MKKLTRLVIIATLLTAALVVNAEKVLYEHTVNMTGLDGYAVDEFGSLITYANITTGPNVTGMRYSLTLKGKVAYLGNLPTADIPANTTAAEISGISKSNILVYYSGGDNDVYITYKVRVNDVIKRGELIPDPNQTCTISKNTIIATTTNCGNPRTIQTYTIAMVLKTKKKVTGLGTLSAVNPPGEQILPGCHRCRSALNQNN